MRTFQKRGYEKWPGIRYSLDAENDLTQYIIPKLNDFLLDLHRSLRKKSLNLGIFSYQKKDLEFFPDNAYCVLQ
jgi:hypothetical protein